MTYTEFKQWLIDSEFSITKGDRIVIAEHLKSMVTGNLRNHPGIIFSPYILKDSAVFIKDPCPDYIKSSTEWFVKGEKQ